MQQLVLKAYCVREILTHGSDRLGNLMVGLPHSAGLSVRLLDKAQARPRVECQSNRAKKTWIVRYGRPILRAGANHRDPQSSRPCCSVSSSEQREVDTKVDQLWSANNCAALPHTLLPCQAVDPGASAWSERILHNSPTLQWPFLPLQHHFSPAAY